MLQGKTHMFALACLPHVPIVASEDPILGKLNINAGTTVCENRSVSRHKCQCSYSFCKGEEGREGIKIFGFSVIDQAVHVVLLFINHLLLL